MKPSEGPWMLNERGQIVEVFLHKQGFSDIICSMPFGSMNEAKEMPQAVTNAKLLLRAPELLQALKYCTIHSEVLQSKYQELIKEIESDEPERKTTNPISKRMVIRLCRGSHKTIGDYYHEALQWTGTINDAKDYARSHGMNEGVYIATSMRGKSRLRKV